jgi:membrane protease YdiL (CAAX protease family)
MLAGFFLGSIFLATRSLYAATAAHFIWNWFMAAGLHTPVSGLPVSTPGYRVTDAGPDWLTGGSWGPEGGLAAAVGMFSILIYLHGRYLSRMES